MYFLMTGFHAIHVIVGMILFAVVLKAGQQAERKMDGLCGKQWSLLALCGPRLDLSVSVAVHHLSANP